MTLMAHKHAPVLLALIAALMWGLWWVPILFLEGVGLKGAWAGQAMNFLMLPFFVLLLVLRPTSLRMPLSAILGGIFVGLAVTLYATALTKTDVVRAVLLFYLAPAWSLLIECAFMGRKFKLANALALVMAALGLVLIFRGDLSLSGWNLGDMAALASGMAWAVGAALIFTNPGLSARSIGLATTLGAIGTAQIILWLDPGESIFAPDPAGLALLYAFLGGTVYLAPIILVTMWGALRLPPATMSFLLTAEIISGVASSAIFLDQRFGLPEFSGAVLIASAALIEVVMPGSPEAKAAEDTN